MTVIISHPVDALDWHKANWVFRQLREDVARLFPDDTEVNVELEQAQAFGSLNFDSIEDSLAARTRAALIAVAEKTVRGEIGGWRDTHPADADGQRIYLESMSELIANFRK